MGNIPINHIRRFFGFLVFTCISSMLFAQFPQSDDPYNDPNDPYNNQRNPEDTLFPGQDGFVEIKNVILTYNLIYSPEKTSIEKRDSLDDTFIKYDPADRAKNLHFNLGNIGSAARSAIYNPGFEKGLHSGMQQYDLYFTSLDSIRYYNPDIPLTSIYASQGNAQEDGLIHARFGSRFADGLSMTANYFRINQFGEYQQQRSKNTDLYFGFHHAPKDSPFESYYAYMANAATHQNNGGVFSYADLALPENQIRQAVDVNLTGSLSDFRDRHFLMQHYYHVRTKGDSSTASKPLFDLHYRFHYNPYSFKNSDIGLNVTEANYYTDFINDARGIRNFISYRKLINRAGFTLFLNNDNSLTASLEHRFISLNQEPIKDKRNEIFINGRIQTKILKRFDLSADGYFGLLDASANFKLNGVAGIDFDKFGKLSGQLTIFQRRPFLIEESAFVNQSPIYQVDHKNVNINLIGVDYKNENWQLNASAKWWIVDNYIYFDTNNMPLQIESPTSIRQISIGKDFTFGPLIFLNKVTLQDYQQEVLRLPSLIIQSSISLNGLIFKKKLRYKIGADLTFTNTHNGVSYFPVTGQFVLNDDRQVTAYPAIDAFIAIQLKSLKIFIKSENANAYFSDKIYDQIIGTPQFESYFRFGFSFQLYN